VFARWLSTARRPKILIAYYGNAANWQRRGLRIEYLIGLILSLAVAGLAAITGFDRERSFYPTVLIIVASYYVLFAVMGASGRTLTIETAVASAFLLVAVLGFKRNLWWVATAIAGHGVFDFFHHLWIDNPGVPRWWPGFCLAFDVSLAVWLATQQYLASRRSNWR
jgi:hypothetical protein